MKKQILALTVMGLLSASVALAVPVAPTGTHNQSLPTNSFGGSGIPANDVTVSTFQGLTLGLSAHQRFVGALPTSVGGVFQATTGESGAPGSGLATWNFNFYINNAIADGGTAAYTYRLSYGTDASGLISFDPTLIPDNAPIASLTTEGNSENLGFGFLGLAIGFNPFANADYAFRLQAFSLTDTAQLNALATSAINVRVGTGSAVPDAGSTCALMGMAFLGIAALRRKLSV